MKKVLITGANKGIGFEAARQLLQAGYFVFLACRDKSRGEQARQQLRAEGFDQLAVIELDVTSDESVRRAAEAVRQHTPSLDALINNAGIIGGAGQQPSTVALETLRAVLETNFYGVVRTTQALLPLLRAAPAPRIVNVSSDLGSLTLHSQPAWEHYQVKMAAYPPSKTLLNAWTVMLAYELRETPVKVNAVNPGFTATDLNHHQGTRTASFAAEVLVKYATLPADGPTGQFFSEDGPTPW
jgi:NAD(P)-dependent dehydrogenase (short-subunit alcohol dehydrogenase family)